MIADGPMIFGIPTITNSTTATVSPNTYNAGAARILFQQGPGGHMPWVWFRTAVTADASPSIMVELRGADAANLTTADITLGSSGIINTTDDGTALVSGETISRWFPIAYQLVAKQHYGLMVTLGGTNPDTVEDTDAAMVVWNPQTNLIYDN